MTWSTILAGEDTGSLGSFLVLQRLSLAGRVTAIEFRLKLLVGCPTTAPLITFDFACNSISVKFALFTILGHFKIIPLA